MPPNNKKKMSSREKSKSRDTKASNNSGDRPSIPVSSRRSRRISGEGVVDSTPSASNNSGARPSINERSSHVDVTPLHQPTAASPTYTNTERDLICSPTTNEAELIRNGIHPITKLQVKNCICTNPKECRAIMWRHAKIGNKKMFYVSLPGIPKPPKEGRKVSKTAIHVNGYRSRSFHHLYGVGNRDVDISTKTKLFVAFHHYHEEYRHILRESSKDSKKMDKWRVPVEIGKKCDPPLTDADLIEEGGTEFFAVPILSSLDSAYAEIAAEETEHNERLKAMHPKFVGEAEAVSVPGRKTPKERRIDIKEKDAKSNPRAAALRMQDLEDEIDRLRVEVKKLKEAAAESDSFHKNELEMQNEIVTTQLMSTGLNRLSMLSDNYHKEKSWLSKYLFGRTWKQHVDIAEVLFHVKPTNVTLDGPITDFEKYCICAMIFRRGYTRNTAAAIYDVDGSSISRYMKVWMPKLGTAGGDCSELDLVMNHNLFSVEYCKENNLPYMENGIAYNLQN